LIPDAKNCALEILEVVPSIMRAIRAEMRSRRTPDLSVPQFRVLTFLNRHPGSSLSVVAEHIGLTPPSMSKIIDGLVARHLITRQDAADDRRRVHLVLTELGKALLEAAYRDTQARLAEMIAGLKPAQYAALFDSMQTLRPIFIPDLERLKER
jgi:DNA-binding MarR family transcriptional regulator